MDVRAAAGPGARGVRALRGLRGRGARPAPGAGKGRRCTSGTARDGPPEAGQGAGCSRCPHGALLLPSPAVLGLSPRCWGLWGRLGVGRRRGSGGAGGVWELSLLSARPLLGSIASSRWCWRCFGTRTSAPEMVPAVPFSPSSPAPAPALNGTETPPNPPALISERAILEGDNPRRVKSFASVPWSGHTRYALRFVDFIHRLWHSHKYSP